MDAIKTINLGVAFLLELCLLASIGYWGFTTGEKPLAKVILGVVVPLLVAAFWGVFLAPASSRRLSEPWLLLVELVLFALAALALYDAGRHTLAVVFALLVIVNKILLYIWKQ